MLLGPRVTAGSLLITPANVGDILNSAALSPLRGMKIMWVPAMEGHCREQMGFHVYVFRTGLTTEQALHLWTTVTEEANRKRDGPRELPLEKCLASPPRRDAGKAAMMGLIPRVCSQSVGRNGGIRQGRRHTGHHAVGRFTLGTKGSAGAGARVSPSLTHPGVQLSTMSFISQ